MHGKYLLFKAAVLFVVAAVNGMDESRSGRDCEIPDIHDGQVRMLDTWPDGFAAMIELDLSPVKMPAAGWSIVVVFDKTLGEDFTFSSWSSQLSAISKDGKTLTLANLKYNKALGKKIKSNKYNTLVIFDQILDAKPQKAYVGFYGHPIEEASCVVPPNMSAIKSAEITQQPVGTTSTSSTKTEATTEVTTIKTTPAISETTNAFDDVSTVTSPTTTMLHQDGTFCVVQQDVGQYATDDTWEDNGKHHFSGNIILNTPMRLEDWWMVAVFEDQITNIETWAISIIDHTETGLVWTFGPHPWSKGLEAGELDVRFIATQGYATTTSPNAQIYICSSAFESGDAVMTRPSSSSSAGEEEAGESEPEATSAATDSPLITLRPVTTPETTTTAISREQRCLPGAKNGHPVERAGQTKPNFAPNNDGTRYNLNELLHKSILFYETQRSGYLPPDNRIPWRGDSALKDGCDIGVDLTGGWYDAGDGVKFNFPMAFSLTTLAWGGIIFRDAYEDAGELQNMIELIKWPTKYFIKTHISKYELVGQVGHGQTDHNYWGRHEQMTMPRPTYKITAKKPGTELAAEVAAALAASSIFLKATDPELAETALKHAREIFEFADNYRGLYHKSITDAARFYKSYSGFNDELVWSATWMYKATNETFYLQKALAFYKKMNGAHKVAHEYSWDDKLVGAQILLAEITKKEDFRRPLQRYLDLLLKHRTTPQGIYYLSDWGSNRYTANAAMISVIGSRLQPPLPRRAKYLQWARKQMGLLFGDSGRSYVVGFGVDPPKRAHHASSSCPPYPERCDWSTYSSPNANHYILYGALVGGPNLKGVYGDNRAIFQESEVACDYNAGFQTAIAGLKQFALENRRARSAAEPTPATTTSTTTTTPTTKPKTTTEQETTQPTTEKTTKPNPKLTKKVARKVVKKPKTKRVQCRPARSPKCIRAARLAKKRQQS